MKASFRQSLRTSRLDDDGIACRFMEAAQWQFTAQDLEFISLPDDHTRFRSRERR